MPEILRPQKGAKKMKNVENVDKKITIPEPLDLREIPMGIDKKDIHR